MENLVKEAEDFIKTHYLNETVYKLCEDNDLEYTELNQILNTFAKMTRLQVINTYTSITEMIDIIKDGYEKRSSVSEISVNVWLKKQLTKDRLN